jgi:hypothetical protein
MFFIEDCSKFPVKLCGTYVVKKFNLHHIFEMEEGMPRAFFKEVDKLY